MATEIPIRGNKQEQDTFTDVFGHYVMAKGDLESRLSDWDTKDTLFRSHINESEWPYRAQVFDPRTFTAVFEKTARLLARKPRGRLVPREGGDALGAHINNELLKFQWDDNERVSASPMLAKWAMMDMNARKYGASFGLAKWHYERQIKNGKDDKKKSTPWFDGPDFRPWNNRDVLHNPSYPHIKNWIQLRDYVTIEELQNVNDAARGKAVYKNLDILRDAVRKDSKAGGDTRASNWTSKNLSIKGLTDYLGTDATNKTIEVITEYRNNRWITFAPKHGLVLRDIPNPYDHQQIPVVLLKYYPIDDDIYGLSELEPVEKLQKAINAVLCQYLDAINQSLYNIVKVKTSGVKMHSLEWGPGSKWLMDDLSNVEALQTSPAGIAEFTATYRFLVGAMAEGLGEASGALSALVPGESKKTATEITDTAIQRNARDNFNQIFLSEAIKKQMLFWHQNNQQFLFSGGATTKVMNIVGKDAIRYFEKAGLSGEIIDDETIAMLASPELEGLDLPPDLFATTEHPVKVKGKTMPKFSVDGSGDTGVLVIEKGDLSGTYNYIPDVESMSLPDDRQILAVKKQLMDLARDPSSAQMLASEGYKLKFKELMEDFFEQVGIKDAEKYFERLEVTSNDQNQVVQGGIGSTGGVQTGGGNVQPTRMVPSAPTVAGI